MEECCRAVAQQRGRVQSRRLVQDSLIKYDGWNDDNEMKSSFDGLYQVLPLYIGLDVSLYWPHFF